LDPAVPRAMLPAETGRCTMQVAHWLPIDEDGAVLVAHLHGRELRVACDAVRDTWRWRVATPHGQTLAEGEAADRSTAEAAAEDEATAVHPPTSRLVDQLLS
jgi:hypothetical protein